MASPWGRLSRLLTRLPLVRSRPSGDSQPRVPVVLYTKRVCPLCTEMKRELARAQTSIPWSLETIAIDGDPGLEERYGLSVPVLCILGRPAFKGRLTAEEFSRKLERRAKEQD